MAGAGFKTWAAGDVLTAAQLNTYIQQQVVMVFAGTAARSSAIGTPSEGMVSYLTDTNVTQYYDGSAWAAVGPDTSTFVTLTGTQTLTNKSLTSPVFTGAALEAVYTTGTGFAGYTFYATTNGAVQYITANSTANGTVNLTSTSGQTLNTLMTTGQSMTVSLLVTNSTAYYPTAYQIDGSAVTPKWSGGSAPTGGNASAIDIYTFTIIKTGSATFTLLATQTKFA